MTLDELKASAASLPLEPGVYLMKNAEDTVIYVGKAKKLKNRVSQYFQDTASHSPKTRKMVSQVHHFETIAAASEFEALILECSLIKHYQPKYNILLKDDKGFPYLRIDLRQAYPTITLCNKPSDDGAKYFGPYGSRGRSNQVIRTIESLFLLPTCRKRFPGDIGKDRPCLNLQMGLCDGWCRGQPDQEEYLTRIRQGISLLEGKGASLCKELRVKMEEAAESLQFELAATLRDRLRAIEALNNKQLVTAGNPADTDVIGWYSTEAKSCFAILHYVGGNLMDKDYEILPLGEDPTEAISSLTKQYYLSGNPIPKMILLPVELEDADLFADLLFEKFGVKTKVYFPKKGEKRKLLALAEKNAAEEAERRTTEGERLSGTLKLLQTMVGLDFPLRRLEAYDISNFGGTDIVASMTVFCDGKPKKKDYKRFKLQGLEDQDDYGSMRQVICRRFCHYLNGDPGFDEKPDALLIDGGAVHANVVLDALNAMEISIPVYGMVKDDRHRTRALVTPDGKEIGIQGNPAVFSLIGRIQEETHRFAITYQRDLRSKSMNRSRLDRIPGIGEKRKNLLLKHFKSISAIEKAELSQLKRLLPIDAAMAVYNYFHGEEERKCE